MASRQDFPEDVSVDVLIVGAGPAGYMAAVTLARYGVDFRMIDQRAETIQGGQASGEVYSPFLTTLIWSIAWLMCSTKIREMDLNSTEPMFMRLRQARAYEEA